MKTKICSLLALCVVGLVTSAMGATSFCITVNDVCCNAGSTSGTYQLSADADFDYYYVYYETVSEANQVKVECFHDGFPVWNFTECGCGTKTIFYPTDNNHLIEIRVTCQACGVLPACYSGTSTVKVYTPSSNGCITNCPGQ